MNKVCALRFPKWIACTPQAQNQLNRYVPNTIFSHTASLQELVAQRQQNFAFDCFDEALHLVDLDCLRNSPRRVSRQLEAGADIGKVFNSCLFAPSFTSGRSVYRQKTSKLKLPGILKACGWKENFSPTIIDCTAGWGRDAYVLASFGCNVRLFERNPVVAALLCDAIARARCAQSTTSLRVDLKKELDFAASRMTLSLGDPGRMKQTTQNDILPIRNFIIDNGDKEFLNRPNTVYMDPMFSPTNSKKGAVKKDTRLLQMLASLFQSTETESKDTEECIRSCASPGQDNHYLEHESATLFDWALQFALDRVVVKRSLNAAFQTSLCFGAIDPTFSVRGSTIRYDVYMVKQLRQLNSATKPL